MKSFNNFSEDFENKILRGEFDKLGSDELKQLEAEGITPEELSEIKSILLALKEIENEEELPSPSLRENLLAAFEEEKPKRGLIISLPFLLSTAASIAALFILVFYLTKSDGDALESKPSVAQQLEPNAVESAPVLEDSEPQIVPVEATEVETKSLNQLPETNSSLEDAPSKEEVSNMDIAPVETRKAEAESAVADYIQEEQITQKTVSVQLNSVASKMESISPRQISESSKKSKIKESETTSMSLNQLPGAINQLITVY